MKQSGQSQLGSHCGGTGTGAAGWSVSVVWVVLGSGEERSEKNVKIAYFNRRKSRRIIFRMSYDNGSQSVGRALPRANLISSTFVSQ